VTLALPRPVLPWVGAAFGSVALGFGIAMNLQVSFILVIAFVGVAALAAPAGAWVICALVAAMTFRGLVEVNALPSVATFVDLPLAWGALAVGLLKQGAKSPLFAWLMRWLGILCLAMALAWAFNPSEVLRPVLYLALLAEPFVILGALLADPPSARMRRALERTVLVLLMVQLPVVAMQLATYGPSDQIQGTLYGAGAGAHVISAVAVVGAVWMLTARVARDTLGGARFVVIAGLLLIPFVADAKQVILAMPVMVLATSWHGNRGGFVLRGALVAAAVVALLTLVPASKTAERFIEENQQGQGGKQAAAVLLWGKVDGDPAAVVFGQGPAETVSRAAFMTTPLFLGTDSPLADLGLKPATLATEAQNTAVAVSGGGTSFDSGTSSALGVLGDLGVFGLLAYLGLLFGLVMRLRRETSAEGIAAASGLALFIVLGLVFDWWEQPPLGVTIGVLAGLSLSDSRSGGNDA
jgi:hypothetical protein